MPARRSRELAALTCYLAVEHLSVSSPTEILGIRLLPRSDAGIPSNPPLFAEGPVGCVAAVDVSGANYEEMSERAIFAANHALRVLRVALREHLGINDWQLRFRVGEAYAFSDGAGGWSARPDSALELGLNDDLVALAMAQPVTGMPMEPRTSVEKKADLAIRWMERARFAGEPLVALLYLTFALEALLGKKSEALKAGGLAMRQAMLSHAVAGGFSHPSKTFVLYDKVRSYAVHGEHVPAVNADVVRDFDWVVRKTLNEYLTYARAEAFDRHSRLVRALDEHPESPNLVAWLREHGGPDWDRYLSRLEETGPRSV